MGDISRRLFFKKGVAGLAAIAVAPELLSCSTQEQDGVKVRSFAPLAGSYDTVVVGGGPAGFIAAITAARQGARTALVERYGFLGGMATIGYVAPISVFAKDNNLVIGGIPWEFVKRLESMGGAFIEWPKANIDFDVELYKLCCQRMVLEAGVDLYMHSSLVGCEMEGKRISSIIIDNKNGLESLEAATFIDCTGDGDLANMAEVPMQPNPDNELQPSSFCFILSGVDTDSELSAVQYARSCWPSRKQAPTSRTSAALGSTMCSARAAWQLISPAGQPIRPITAISAAQSASFAKIYSVLPNCFARISLNSGTATLPLRLRRPAYANPVAYSAYIP